MAVVNNLPMVNVFETFTTRHDNQTVGSSTYISNTISIAKAGYTPRALAGYYVENGSGGANSSFCLFSSCMIDGNTLFYRMRNVTNSQARINLVFYIVYEKDA